MYQWLFLNNTDVFAALVQSTFEMSRMSVEIALGLAGVLIFWLGLFQIAEKAGLIGYLSRILAPLFSRLMPEVPRGHPAIGSVTMNLAANMLGLDNAATPMGLKAMADLQELNPDKNTASNAQILFLVLNTSAVTLIPVTIFLYRAQQGATDVAVVFIPILIATTASTLAGLIAVAFIQRINIFDRVVLAYFSVIALIMVSIILYFTSIEKQHLSAQATFVANFVLFAVIIGIIASGYFKRLDIYSVFLEGAKQGFDVAIKLIPYLLAMLVAIGLLRASGALDMFSNVLVSMVSAMGLDTDFVDAIPTAIMKPFSGSGSRAMMIETMTTHGVDSFPALLASIIQGSTETTFYVLAVYFGSVGIKNIRHALFCGLVADITGIVTAILIGYYFFH